MFQPDFMGPVGFFVACIIIVKFILDYRLKRKLLERGEIDKNITSLFFNKTEYFAPTSLKWGLVLIGIGLAVVIGQMLPYDFNRGEITFSLMLIFAGGGLLIYYFVANQKMKEHRKEQRYNTPSPPSV